MKKNGRKEIDYVLCKGCGICVDMCPKHVFDRDALGKPVIARNDDCIVCHICELHCPDFAIEFPEEGEANE